MADKIGSVFFNSVDGVLDNMSPAFVDVSRPNTNGRAFKRLGSRGDITQILAHKDFLSASAANAALLTYKAMKGTAVSIQQLDEVRGTFFIIEVQERPKQKGVLAVGGQSGGVVVLETVWTIGAVA